MRGCTPEPGASSAKEEEASDLEMLRLRSQNARREREQSQRAHPVAESGAAEQHCTARRTI